MKIGRGPEDRHHHRVMLRERRRQRPPGISILRVAVQEHHRRARTAPLHELHEQLRTVDANLPARKFLGQ
ncbi:MAG TPA: hypothetical protein VNO21_09565 [Polyangiaceae bacterium]|nr:hypothetical protein [Polyangiaceae bacterium]